MQTNEFTELTRLLAEFSTTNGDCCKELTDHLQEPLSVMVIGSFSAGKSTFINALAGRKVAATRATPTTAVVTKLCYAEQGIERILVHFKNGKIEEFSEEAFEYLTAVNEKGTPEEAFDHGQIDYVERQLPLEFFKTITLIDSPGLNDITATRSDAAERFVKNADAVLWMFWVGQLGTAEELAAMKGLDSRIRPLAIINKMDLLDEEEDDEEEILARARDMLGDSVLGVVGISAQYAFDGIVQQKEQLYQLSGMDKVMSSLEEVILPRRAEFKLELLIDQLGAVLDDLDEYINDTTRQKELFFEVVDRLKVYCEAKAEAGHGGNAALFLGRLAFYGIGCRRDLAAAETYFQRAAAEEKPDMLRSIAGILFEADQYAEALPYYQKLAELHDAEAANMLGRYADLGLGEVKVNKATAAQWYQAAANAGLAAAQKNLAGLYETGEGVAQDLAKAFALYEKAAQKGDLVAMNALGRFYEEGLGGLEADPGRAAKLYQEACSGGYLPAAVKVGRCYRDGIGTEKDLDKAVYFFKKAAQAGNVEAVFGEADIYLDQEKYKEAFPLIKKAAQAGWPEACLAMGFYFQGCFEQSVVPVNPSQAVKWYTKAAEKGNTDAMYVLAQLYLDGNGVEENDRKAFKFCKKSAEGGNLRAQAELGYYYETGTGCSKDMLEAVRWYESAAAGGSGVGKYRLAQEYYLGETLKQDYRKAFGLLKEAVEAEPQLSGACIGLALCYENGYGCKVDKVKAFEYYQRSVYQVPVAEADVEGEYSLGNCYFCGIGTSQDFKRAYYWFKRAAKHGKLAAVKLLGKMHEKGMGCEQDLKRAHRYLKEASDANDAEAQYLLAEFICEHEDDFLQYDFDDAMKLLKKSARNGYPRAQKELQEIEAGIAKRREENKENEVAGLVGAGIGAVCGGPIGAALGYWIGSKL